jgi:three-Cys-motif partner protein
MAYHRRQVFCYEGSFVHPTNFSLASVVENLQQNELPSCYLEAEANGNNLQRVVFVDQRFPVKEMIVCNGKGGASSEVSQIGYWSEIKLDIVREYAAAYSKILAAQHRPRLSHVYIDAFAGAGYHITKAEGDLVWGSPLNALLIDPPFDEYHFIDLDKGNVNTLEMLVESRTSGPYDPRSVHLYNADCNDLLLSEIFPKVRYEDYQRALCLLDPYGLHLRWEVLAQAGKMRSIEVFVNFPIADINRNVLLRDPSKVRDSQVKRMNAYWGDESWREEGYTRQWNLFGFEEKASNEEFAEAFRVRLKEIAGFSYVPKPIPMRNTKGAIVYYLFFASHKPVAAIIVSQIFDKYRERRA